MNRNKSFRTAILLFSLFAACVIVTSCSSDDDDTPKDAKEVEVSLSRKTNYGDDWIYYSLEKGKEVSIDEATHAESTEWDLAFNRYNVRTNSGKSGKGNGGAMITTFKSFSDCKAVPAGDFTVDADYEISDIGEGFPPPTKISTANEVLCKAITFAGPPPTYTPSDYVFIVRTATGKYAKFMAMSFYDKEANSGIYSFKYVLQDDGSTNFD